MILVAPNAWLQPNEFYRWFLVVYQVGVFSSRSVAGFLKPRQTYWAPIAQFFNVCFFMYVATRSGPTSAWIIFIMVFTLGAVGGICFTHTFRRLIKELPPNQHKFSLGMLTIAESSGIAIGGLIAINVHNILCGKFFLQ